MGKSKLARTGLLSCFGCGLAALERDGSGVAGARRVSDAPATAPNRSLDRADADSVCAAAAPESLSGSRPSTAGSRSGARRPSTAFTEPAAADPLPLGTASVEKSNDTAAAAGEDAPATPFVPGATATAAAAPSLMTPGAASFGSGGAAAATALAGGPSSASVLTEVLQPRRPPRKPRSRTSRVSPAYDTEDELSPAGLSRSPSGSADGSSSPRYSSSFPSLEEEPLQEAEAEGGGGDGGGGVDVDDTPTLRRGREPAITDGGFRAAEERAEVAGGARELGAPAFPGAGGEGAVVPLFQKSASLPSTLAMAAAAAAAAATAAGGGRTSRVHSRATSAASTAAVAPAGAPATRRSSTGGNADSRSTSIASRVSGGGAASRITSAAAERPGAAATAGPSIDGPAEEPSSPRLAFTRRGSSCSRAGAAAAAAACVLPAAPTNDTEDDGGSGGDGPATIARRGSFAGDSSTSLVGPASVATPLQMRNCPSLRQTQGSQPTLQEPPPQLLGPCESLRLLPLPPPPPLHTCGSLRLAPLSPPRLLTPSPSLRPTPLLLPSPSLNRRPPSGDLLMLLPGSQAPEPSASGPCSPVMTTTPTAPSGDQMLRLPPQQQQPTLLHHSPCSLGRSAFPFPRANTLAPLPAENTAALNRLASLQAAFRERQPQQQQEAPQPPSGAKAAARGGAVGPSAATPAPQRGPQGASAELQGAASSERGGVSTAPCAATAAPGVIPTTTVTAAGAGDGDGGGDEPYDSEEYDEYDEDVASMVSHLLPPSSFRSSAPAIPYGTLHISKEHVRRTGSLEQPRATADGAAAAAAAALASCAAPLSDMGVATPSPAAAAASEPALESDQTSLGTHAAKWLEELLPPSPGYRSPNGTTGRSGFGPAATTAAGRKPAAAPAVDSFKCLMREID